MEQLKAFYFTLVNDRGHFLAGRIIDRISTDVNQIASHYNIQSKEQLKDYKRTWSDPYWDNERMKILEQQGDFIEW